MSRIAFFALLILATASCGPKPSEGVIDDTDETAVSEITVPGYETPSRILYGKPDAFICRGVTQTTRALLDRLAQAAPYRDGYSFVDVSGPDAKFRAYFKVDRVVGPMEATFVFCSGIGASHVGSQCMLIGTSEDGCFQTFSSIYSLSELDSLGLMANRKYPTW